MKTVIRLEEGVAEVHKELDNVMDCDPLTYDKDPSLDDVTSSPSV